MDALADMTLPELFAAADAIGCRYQAKEDRADYLEELLDAIYGVEGWEREVAAIETELQQLRSSLKSANQQIQEKAKAILEKYPLL